jgi:hypothetical protein
LGPEEEEVNASEMVAWKWSQDFSECRVRAAIRYCIGLSAVRSSSEPDFSFLTLEASRLRDLRFGFRLTRSGLSGSEWRRRFFPRVFRAKEIIVADSLVFSQYWTDDELPLYDGVLPSYEDVEAASVACVA